MAAPQLDVLFEDNHLLVVNKPPELATMGAERGQPSLVDRARDYIRDKYHKPGNVFLGVVSRLDSFTTGVVVLARTSKAASRLAAQFRERTPAKTYWALVPDRLPNDSGMLSDWVAKNDSKHRMEIVGADVPGAREARLRYRRLGRSEGVAWVEIELETGRKHQVRVQFSGRGCPVVGDRKYGSSLSFPKGIALHAQSLGIIHPTLKTKLTFQCSPPIWWNLDRFPIS